MFCTKCGKEIMDYINFKCGSCGAYPAVPCSVIAQYYAAIGGCDKLNFLWSKKGAEAGEALSAFMLAACYLGGIGTDADEKKGYEWIKFAAEHGCKDAYTVHGNKCIRDGNLHEAERWHMLAYQKDNKDIAALTSLSTIKREQGDLVGAIEWLEKAVDAGDTDSMLILGAVKASTVSRTYLEDGYCLCFGFKEMAKNGDIIASEQQCKYAEQILRNIEILYSENYGDLYAAIQAIPVDDFSPSNIRTDIPLIDNLKRIMRKYDDAFHGFPFVRSPQTETIKSFKKAANESIRGMRSRFAANSIKENVLLLVDYCVGGETGFMITDHGIYYSSDRNNPAYPVGYIPIPRIARIRCERDIAAPTDGCLVIEYRNEGELRSVKFLLIESINDIEKLGNMIERTICINEIVGTVQKYMGVPVLETYRMRGEA